MAVPGTEEPAVSVSTDGESSPVSPVQALNENIQVETATLAIQLVWKDTGAAVSTTTLTLTPMTDAESTSTGQALTASTDADGKALLPFPTRYPWLRLDAQITSAAPATFKLDTQDPLFNLYTTPGKGESLRLEVQRLYGLSGTVYASGAGQAQPVPVPGAEVSLSTKSYEPWPWFKPQEIETTTTVADASGHYRFRRIPYSFFHLSARSSNLTTGGRDVVLKGEGTSDSLDLTLEPGFSITLLVNDKKTLKPIPGALVQAQYEDEGVRVSAQTNAEGFADLPPLPTGSVSLKITADGYQTEKAITDITGTLRDITLFSLTKAGTARIKTVDSRNIPVPNTELYLNWEAAPEKLTIRTDEKGEARLTELPLNTVIRINEKFNSEQQVFRSLVLDGQEREIAVLKEMASSSITGMRINDNSDLSQQIARNGQSEICRFFLLEGQEKEITYVLTPREAPEDAAKTRMIPYMTGWVGGKVVGTDNQPVAGAIIESLYGVEALTDQNGIFRVENLKFSRKVTDKQRRLSRDDSQFKESIYGVTNVCISAKDYRSDYVSFKPETEQQISLRRMDKMKGHLLDRETNKPICLFDLVYYGFSQRDLVRKRYLSETGEFTFRGRVYDLRAIADGYKPEEISRSNDASQISNLEVYLKRGESLKGCVVDEKTREPLRDVLVGCGDGYPGNDVLPFSDTHLTADYVELTNVEGEFDFKRVFGEKGQLVFFRADLDEKKINLVTIEKYRDWETGRLIIPLRPRLPRGSVVLEWINNGNPEPCPEKEPSDSPWKPREESPIRFPRIMRGSSQISFSDPSFSYANGIFRWDNLKPGEYSIQLPQITRDGRVEEKYLTKTFTLESQEVKTIRWGAGHADSLSGRILNAQNEPYPQVNVRLTLINPNQDMSSRTTIRETFATPDGSYRFDCLFPGEYAIVIVEIPLEEGKEEKVLVSNETVKVDGATKRDITINSQ